jgi:hypothetical protein
MRSPWNRGSAGGENEETPDPLGAVPPGGASGLNAEEWDVLRTAPDYDAEEMSNVWPGESWTPPALLSDTLLGEDLPAPDAAAPAVGGHPSPGWPPPVGTAPAAPRGADRGEAMPVAPVNAPETPGSGPAAGGAWRPPNRVEPPARQQTPPRSVAGAAATVASATAGEPAAGRQPAPTAPATDGVSQQYPEARTLALLAEDLLGRPLDEPAPAPAPPPAARRQPPIIALEVGHPDPVAAPRAPGGPTGDLWEQVMPLWAESAEPSPARASGG